MWIYNVFRVLRDHMFDVLHDLVITLVSLGSTDLMEVVMAFVISVPIPIPISMPRF